MTATPLLPDDLSAEMDRLGNRPYAEIGVPMYLVLEDLTGTMPQPLRQAGDPELAAAFTKAAEQVAAAKGTLEAGDIARIIEVLADRSFLSRPFSDLSDESLATK
ncbi:MAG: hypothetical protein H6895_02780 [Defluviimonas sp.]|uniref:hypothetical protein n=1 Tax=Albidovulum sp. TaxID=1872424 RepID=UPI002A311EA7|nr:hypothetical protein [Defluviimonas sp.]